MARAGAVRVPTAPRPVSVGSVRTVRRVIPTRIVRASPTGPVAVVPRQWRPSPVASGSDRTWGRLTPAARGPTRSRVLGRAVSISVLATPPRRRPRSTPTDRNSSWTPCAAPTTLPRRIWLPQAPTPPRAPRALAREGTAPTPQTGRARLRVRAIRIAAAPAPRWLVLSMPTASSGRRFRLRRGRCPSASST